jgi:hypothetical protein
MVVVNRIFLAIAWIGAVALGSPVARSQGYPAQIGQIHYDQSKCSKDPQGMVYFAVGRRVFRQPMDNLVYISTGSPQDQALYPRPPDPSEPVGCPDHPIPGGSYNLRHFSAMPEDPPNAFSLYADHISVIVNDGSHGAYTQDGLFNELSKTRGLAERSIPGFVETGKGSAEFYYYTYKALQYLTPGGQNLTISCHNDLSNRHNISEYGYMFAEDVAISTTFVTENVPMAELFGADQELRRRIDAAQIKDFQWSDASKDK